MLHKAAFLVFFLLLSVFANTNGVVVDDHCDRKSLPDPLTLDPDQITVLISGYSQSRIPLLRSLAVSYSSHPLVSKTLILWFNPNVSSNLLAPLSSLPDPISLHLSSSSSLNSRFLPRRQILTRSVLIADDDVEVSPESLSFAFNVWRSNADSVVGFFARSHDLDLGSRSWIYTVHRDRYSIILTKAMVVRTEYLYSYSCGGGGGEGFGEARRYVDKERNCEDILMNFLVAIESEGSRPVLVEGRERVRDWGDPRNENNENGDSDDGGGGGLSSRGDHWKKRGDCIREFHRILGRMPLRYGYGKVVDGAGQQGMCRKGGRLVPCEQQV